MCFPWDIEQRSPKQGADRMRADGQIQYCCEGWHLCEKPGRPGSHLCEKPGRPGSAKRRSYVGQRASGLPGPWANRTEGPRELESENTRFCVFSLA